MNVGERAWDPARLWWAMTGGAGGGGAGGAAAPSSEPQLLSGKVSLKTQSARRLSHPIYFGTADGKPIIFIFVAGQHPAWGGVYKSTVGVRFEYFWSTFGVVCRGVPKFHKWYF